MKYALIVLLVFNIATKASSQEHHLFADISPTPGFSATYNYKLAKHWGVGGGLQVYKMSPTLTNARHFIPAIFGDIRLNIRPEKDNQFFAFFDLGVNVYKQEKKYLRSGTEVWRIPHNNGVYSGLGFGYMRRMTSRGGGVYVSLKLPFNWYTEEVYSIVSESDDTVLLSADGNINLSVGFKF